MGKPGISAIAPIGKRFGNLIVVSSSRPGKNTGSSTVDCRCDCGDIRSYYIGNLLRFKGTVQCPQCREAARPSKGMHKHPLFNIWKGIIQRCENPNHTHYELYGGRGIRMCQSWRDDFTTFAADLGERPSMQHSIDRIDVDGNYEPANCRWAKSVEQGSNRRDNRIIEHGGEALILSDWSKRTGLTIQTISFRLKSGWSIERALTTPARRGKSPPT